MDGGAFGCGEEWQHLAGFFFAEGLLFGLLGDVRCT